MRRQSGTAPYCPLRVTKCVWHDHWAYHVNIESKGMRTVLWDLDGTLADTGELHYLAWQQIMDGLGVPYDYAEFLTGFGRNNRSILSEKFQIDPDSPRVNEIAASKEVLFRQLLPSSELDLLPGVLDCLAALAAAGVQQVISSSGPMANIAATVNKLGIGDYFLALMSGATLPRGKPHPDLFLNSAAAVGVSPSWCIVVEDSTHGIEAARRAGMVSIAVGTLANSALLADLLAEVPGPTCFSAPNLAETTWSTWEGLWTQASTQAQTST
jgi:HAD superfamily hydrolase (TIGR01509 family)